MKLVEVSDSGARHLCLGKRKASLWVRRSPQFLLEKFVPRTDSLGVSNNTKSKKIKTVCMYPLSSTVGVSLRAADPEDVDGAAVSTVEAAIVEAVSVDPTDERLRGPQSKLHSVLTTHLVH